MFFISLKFAFECMFLTNSFCLKRVYKALFSFKTCILQMAPGWDAWEQVDSDKCDTLSSLKWTSFITLFVSEALWSHLLLFSPLNPFHSRVLLFLLPPLRITVDLMTLLGSQSLAPLNGLKPFLVLAWASGAEYGLQCRPNSCRDDCITRCFPKGRVQCSQDRFLLKRWLCLSDSFSLFWSTFQSYPPVIFLFSYILKCVWFGRISQKPSRLYFNSRSKELL